MDIEFYASPNIPYEKMRQMRKGLAQGVNLAPFLHLNAGILRQLRKAVAARVIISPYVKEGYQAEQLEQIRQALERELDIQPYLTRELRGVAIREIWKGLEDGLDVGTYARLMYTANDMKKKRQEMMQDFAVELELKPQ